MSAKIKTAIEIVKETNSEVFIVQVGTAHAYRALNGEMVGDDVNQVNNRKNWIGTRISLWKE